MNEIHVHLCCLFHSSIDLVPVSSTVIPLYTHQVNSTDEAKYHTLDEEEYRVAYMKLLMHKKHAEVTEDPDTLITCNSRQLVKIY